MFDNLNAGYDYVAAALRKNALIPHFCIREIDMEVSTSVFKSLLNL